MISSMDQLPLDVKNYIAELLTQDDINIIKDSYELTSDTFCHYLKLGYLGIAKLLCKLLNDMEYGHIIREAIKYNRLDFLQWAFVDGRRANHSICDNAAKYGHLEIIIWAYSKNCLLDCYTCHNAAANGHLNVLQWALANGCEWTESIYNIAKRNGQQNILNWISLNVLNKRQLNSLQLNIYI